MGRGWWIGRLETKAGNGKREWKMDAKSAEMSNRIFSDRIAPALATG